MPPARRGRSLKSLKTKAIVAKRSFERTQRAIQNQARANRTSRIAWDMVTMGMTSARNAGGDTLVVMVLPAPELRGPSKKPRFKYGVAAVSMPKAAFKAAERKGTFEGSLDAAFTNHAHDVIGSYATLPRATRAAERYLKRWLASTGGAPLERCACGPIRKGAHGPNKLRRKLRRAA